VLWVSREQHEALLGGSALGTPDREPSRIAAFCARQGIPWRAPNTSIACFDGPVPLGIAAEHRGQVRLTLDVEWLLEEIKLVSPAPMSELLLAMADRQDRGLPVHRELAAISILGGAPADRGDAIAAAVNAYRGSRWVEARLLRAIDVDDVDSWMIETGLPILEA